MPYPIVMNLGVGRSGTTFAHNQLRVILGEQAHVLHEDINARSARVRKYFRCYENERIEAALAEPTIGSWVERIRMLAEKAPVVITGGTTSHLAPVMAHVFEDRLRTIHVFRHPINVAAAMFVGSWSTNWCDTRSFVDDPTGWVLTPDDPYVRYQTIAPRWPELGPFARIAYNWLERTSAAVEFTRLHPQVAHRDIKAETDVFKSDRYIRDIAALLEVEFPADVKASPSNQNAQWLRSVEERPLGEAWRQIFEIPEVIEMGTSLGYGFEAEEVAANIRKYQLPPGIGPWVRHYSGYWKARRHLARLLREKSLIPPARPVLGGGAPRSTWSALAELLPPALKRGAGKNAE